MKPAVVAALGAIAFEWTHRTKVALAGAGLMVIGSVAGLAKTHQLAGPVAVEHALLKRPRLYGTGVTR